MNSSPKTRYKYLHVNSDLSIKDGDEARYKISLHGHPIKNCHRVAVKNFSTANTIFNIVAGKNLLQWGEWWSSAAGGEYSSRVFSIEIPPGRYTMAVLLPYINTAIAAMPPAEHKLAAEQPLKIVLEHDEDTFITTITITQPTGYKYFVPITNEVSTIWGLLGFKIDSQCLTSVEFVALKNPATQFSPALNLAIASPGKKVISLHSATIENVSGIYLVSKVLTNGNTYETRENQLTGNIEATPHDILEWVAFDSPSYAFVHHVPNVLHWHYINDININEIDIALYQNDLRTPIKKTEHARFNLVLVFETIEHDEYSAEYGRIYKQEGYALAHSKERIIFK